jgi:mRNA interferase HigB
MRLTNKKILEKLKRKNRGNIPLTKAIDQLIKDIDENN